MKKSDIFWQTYLNLEKEMIEVSKYIFITDEITVRKNGVETTQSYDAQMNTFSPHLADLLVRCCVQIEAISKELYHANGGTKPRGDKTLFFDEDCLKLIDIKWNTHNKRVLVVAPFFNLTKDKNRVLRPLKEAHKRSEAYWAKAYQAVKHDRFASLSYGNVKAVLHALAALYLLNVYYRNDSWVIPYKDLHKMDYSLNSSIFALNPPKTDQPWYGNEPQQSESPYVVTYKAEDYKRIEEMQKSDYEALNNYWIQQPELQDAEFLSLLLEKEEKQRQDLTSRVMYIWELAKFRLKKMLPSTMPFEERKRQLINSDAWKCNVKQNNKQFSFDKITEDNIEKVIENVGIRWGIDIELRYSTKRWMLLATNDAMCEVYIPH